MKQAEEAGIHPFVQVLVAHFISATTSKKFDSFVRIHEMVGLQTSS